MKTNQKNETANGARAPRTTYKQLTRATFAEEHEAWSMLYAAYPKAVTAIAEYAYMIDMCVYCVFPKADRRPEPRRLCKLLLEACNKVDGNAALTLTYCWREVVDLFKTGYLPADFQSGLQYLRHAAPSSFAAIARLDALLPSVLCFPTCPRLLAPAALMRSGLEAAAA